MITDRQRLGPHAESALIRRVAAASRAGVHLIQIRERDMPDNALLLLVARAVEAVHGTRARILVNDRIDVAIAAGAHGVHLRADSVSAGRVRPLAPPGFVIGRSVHSREDVVRARGEGGVDYLLFGTVFETSSKPGRVTTGIPDLAEAASAAGPLPVLAVGGVTLGTVGRLAGTGCAGFAAIGQFADCPEERLATAVAGAVFAWENPR
jgi:thiamine-phosphate diphosphorylase